MQRNLSAIPTPMSLLRSGLLLAVLAGAASANAATHVYAGANCRSTGASSETGTGELINDTMGINPGDFATFICPVTLPVGMLQGSVTVGVSGATNFRHGQSFCALRSMQPDGTQVHQDNSGFFSTNDTNSKQTDSVSMTVTVLPGGINSVHLRCRLMSNGTNKPKNSIIMYWLTTN